MCTRDIEAALRDLITQGSCYIARPHSQRRIVIIVKRIISPYIQNVIIIATKGSDGEEEGSRERKGFELIIYHIRRGGGRLIYQFLVPNKLSSQSLYFAKQIQNNPYQTIFRNLIIFLSLALKRQIPNSNFQKIPLLAPPNHFLNSFRSFNQFKPINQFSFKKPKIKYKNS